MPTTSQVFALLAAILHLLIFGAESLWFMRPGVHRRFGAATREAAEACRLFAFNQGFYNLFLALGVLGGLLLLRTGGNTAVARTLVLFGCACMAAAGLVLLVSGGRRMLRAAVLQAAFPILAWLTWIGA